MSNKSHFFRQSSGGGGEPFIATFRTTTANESITLPYLSNGTYSGTIDFGDGTVVANSYANRTHTYINSGDYDVTILGECVGWNFASVSASKAKIIDVNQWGNGIGFIYVPSGGYFVNCSNLDVTATDTLTLSGSIYAMFRGCSSLFWSASVNSVDVSSATNFDYLFFQCFDFNQPLNNWNTSNVTRMRAMFRITDFNQDISSWDFSGLNSSTSLFQFMSDQSASGYQSSYYDNLLIKWASNPSLGGLQPNIIGTIDMGGIKYTANGASARASILANNKAVTINDGGQI